MAIDYFRVECALLGNLEFNALTPEEREAFLREKGAFEVGQLANRLGQGYYAHTAANILARQPNSKNALTSIQPGQPFPTETVVRKNGTTHVFDSHYYLDQFNTPEMVDEASKVWLVGSLLTLGDALYKHKYFNHLPEFELVYHLRNGIAHGNHFHFFKPGLERLAKFPAHNRSMRLRTSNAEFEITPALKGQQVIFGFMGPGDVLDLLLSISFHLMYLRGRLGSP